MSKTKMFLSVMFVAVFATASMSFVSNANAGADYNYCTITVKDKDGDLQCERKVTIWYAGSWEDFYTDKKGKVTIKWDSGYKLKKVCCRGECHEVSYENGGNYTLYLRDSYNID